MIDKNDKNFRHVDVYIQYSNAVVPNFDEKGKPDLLAWDEDMQSHEPDREPLATIYQKDIAEVCEKAIRQSFNDVNLNEVYESDYVSIEFDEVYDTKEDGPTLQWYWEDIVQDAHAYEKHLSQVDYHGEDFKWENQEELYKQVPPISDFIHFIEEEAASHVTYFQKGNSSDYFPIRFRLENLRKLMELAEKLYGSNKFD
tara:strand:- start:62 stop:658 length:597 start_codon:yes stop_codon:yes gene_type:complete